MGIPAQGPGAIQGQPSAYSGSVVAVAGGIVQFVVPQFSGTRVQQTTTFVGVPTAGAACAVLFTDGPPLVIIAGAAYVRPEDHYIAGEADDSGSLTRASAYAQDHGGVLVLEGRDYIANSGWQIAADKPLRVIGAGMGMSLYGVAQQGPTRVRRTSGSTTLLSAPAAAGTRQYLEIEGVEFEGHGTTGTLLDIERWQNGHMRRVRCFDTSGTGISLKQAFNCSMSDVYVQGCGNGAGTPAMLISGFTSGQGGTATLHMTNVEFEGNNGTDLKVGSGGLGYPSVDIKLANVKFEGGGAAAVACPYLDVDDAHGVSLTNVGVIVHGTTSGMDRTVAPLKFGTTVGYGFANQLSNVVVTNNNLGGGAIPSAVQLVRGVLHVSGISAEPGTGGFSQAVIRVDSTAVVTVNDLRADWGTVSASGSGLAYLSDARTGAQQVPHVASASTITLPEYAAFVHITGTTNINTITASRAGRVVAFYFGATATLKNGTGNLLLGADVTTTVDDVIFLISNGASWLRASPIAAN